MRGQAPLERDRAERLGGPIGRPADRRRLDRLHDPGARRLGCRVEACTTIGDDAFGTHIQRELEAAGIGTRPEHDRPRRYGDRNVRPPVRWLEAADDLSPARVRAVAGPAARLRRRRPPDRPAPQRRSPPLPGHVGPDARCALCRGAPGRGADEHRPAISTGRHTRTLAAPHRRRPGRGGCAPVRRRRGRPDLRGRLARGGDPSRP